MTGNAEKGETYWSRFSRVYDENQAYVVGRDLLEGVTARLSSLPYLGDVVEFGCGAGYFTGTIASRADRVVATDLSNELLEAAARRFQGDSKITFQKEDCRDTAFSDGALDTVFAANVIHVIERPEQMVRESRRILKAAGRLIIVSFTNDGMGWLETIRMGFRFLRKWGPPPPGARGISLDELRAMVEGEGFTVETAELLGNKTKSLFLIAVAADGECKGLEKWT